MASGPKNHESNARVRIGITFGAFDLLHAGHVAMLQEAKEHCDYLIVGLQANPALDRDYKARPIQSHSERYIQLKAVKYVDEIIPYSTEAEVLALLKLLPIDIRILGEQYKTFPYTGKELDIPIHFNRRAHNFSTAELRERIINRK